MYPKNPEGTRVIVGSMNMEYISDTARNRTHNLFRPKREPIPLGHNDDYLIRNVFEVCIGMHARSENRAVFRKARGAIVPLPSHDSPPA